MGEEVWIHPEGAVELVDAMKAAEMLVSEQFVKDLQWQLRVAQSEASQAAQKSYAMYGKYREFLREYQDELRWRTETITSADPATVDKDGDLQAGETPFDSAEEAQAKAQELANKYLDDGELTEEEWAELRKYQNDPEFAVAFLEAVGPEAFYYLATNAAQDPEQAAVIGLLLAAASNKGFITADWLAQVKSEGGNFGISALAPLLKYGDWDTDALVLIGQTALNSGQDLSDQEFAALLEGISRDPIAANRLYSAEFDRINELLRGQTSRYGSKECVDALDSFVTAATIEAYDAYEHSRPPGDPDWENPATALTDRLITEFAAHPDKPPAYAEIQHTFGDIITFYANDVWDSVTSPVPDIYATNDPGRPGVEATAAEWAVFTQMAMANPETAAGLATLFSTMRETAWENLPDGHKPGSGLESSNNYSAYQITSMDDWFRTQVDTVNKNMEGKNAKWLETMNGFIDKGVEFAFDPRGGILGLGKDFIKMLGKDAVKAWATTAPNPIDSLSPTKADLWQNSADKAFEDGIIIPVDGHDGDPHTYEKEYGAVFTEEVDGKTTIMDPASMSPEARRAYEAWLQDPAVQNAAWALFDASTSETDLD